MRNISEDNNTVYRVVTTYADGSKSYEGPYATRASARGRATSLTSYAWSGEKDAERTVQKMSGEWEEDE